MPGPIVYVPSRVGEGYFTDWQAPVAGDNGKTWIYNHGTGKFEPYAIPTVAPGGSTGYIQYNNAGAFGASGVYWDSVNSRVGIGTTGPQYKLDISSASDTDLLRLQSTATANNTVLRLGISGGDAVISGSGGSNGRLLFKTYGSDRMVIDTSGNVGIGTTSPSQKLDVNGSVNVATALIVPVVRPASDSTTAWKVTKADGTTSVITVDTTNSIVAVGGATETAYKLKVYGNLGITGNLTVTGSFLTYNDIPFYQNAVAYIQHGLSNGSYNSVGIKTLHASSYVEMRPANTTVCLFKADGMYVTGKIGTSSSINNTNTPSGATAKAMPIYDVAGTLLGYIPVYASQW